MLTLIIYEYLCKEYIMLNSKNKRYGTTDSIHTSTDW